MDEIDSETVDELKSEVESFEDTSISKIPFELLEKQGNRTTKLIESSGDVSPIDGRRRWHDFRFKRPFLVTQVRVETSGYGEINEFELGWLTETGAERHTTATPENGSVIFNVNDICAAVSFRPPSVFFARAHINSVRIEGVSRDDVPAALESLSHLETLKQNIIDIADRAVIAAEKRLQEASIADQHRTEVQREIATLKQSVSRLKRSVDDLSLKKNELIVENGEATRALEESTARHTSLVHETGLLEKKRKSCQKI